MARKNNKSRRNFLADMDELARNIASATKRLPNNILTEKVDAFKALTAVRRLRGFPYRARRR